MHLLFASLQLCLREWRWGCCRKVVPRSDATVPFSGTYSSLLNDPRHMYVHGEDTCDVDGSTSPHSAAPSSTGQPAAASMHTVRLSHASARTGSGAEGAAAAGAAPRSGGPASATGGAISVATAPETARSGMSFFDNDASQETARSNSAHADVSFMDGVGATQNTSQQQYQHTPPSNKYPSIVPLSNEIHPTQAPSAPPPIMMPAISLESSISVAENTCAPIQERPSLEHSSGSIPDESARAASHPPPPTSGKSEITGADNMHAGNAYPEQTVPSARSAHSSQFQSAPEDTNAENTPEATPVNITPSSWQDLSLPISGSDKAPTDGEIQTRSFKTAESGSVHEGGNGANNGANAAAGGVEERYFEDAEEGGEAVEWVMHPCFPDLPPSVPLTYVLAMHACLSRMPGERPTFSQV